MTAPVLHTHACLSTRTRSRDDEQRRGHACLEKRGQKMFWVWTDGHASRGELGRQGHSECRPSGTPERCWAVGRCRLLLRRYAPTEFVGANNDREADRSLLVE